MMDRFLAKEDEYKVAWIKRFLEYDAMIPGFHEEETADPQTVIKKYGFPLTVEEFSFYPGKPEDGFMMRPVFPDSDASKYAEYIKRKLEYRNDIKEKNCPSNKAMRKWHKRQQGRCLAVLGGRCEVIVHVPFSIELSEGCSVGCEFCGLNAGRLKSVFRYDEENARLFNDVLTGTKELLGDCAGEGTMYFATESLDNPDYESFLKDYIRIFDRIPQITTAVALRHKERMHALLAELNEDGRTIYRFSVLSVEDALKIFEEFTPEELVYTELLPQYEESKATAFANAGRRGKEQGELDGTISCVTGFIVNFSNKTVRLTTPTSADDDHPTGEIILDNMPFDDAKGCIEAMQAMIKKYMKNTISPRDRVRLRKGLSWEKDGEQIVVDCGKGARFTIAANESGDIYNDMLEMFEDGYHTRGEIVAKLTKRFDGALVRTEMLYYAISRLWELGILELESGQI